MVSGEHQVSDLVGRVVDAFRDRVGRDPDGVWAAPGRVNLIGEHLITSNPHLKTNQSLVAGEILLMNSPRNLKITWEELAGD